MSRTILEEDHSLGSYLNEAFAARRFIGAADRRQIRAMVCDMFRFMNAYDNLVSSPSLKSAAAEGAARPEAEDKAFLWQIRTMSWVIHRRGDPDLFFGAHPYGVAALSEEERSLFKSLQEAYTRMPPDRFSIFAAALPPPLQTSFGAGLATEPLLQALNTPADVDLIARHPLQSPADLQTRLRKEGIATVPTPWSPSGLRLQKPMLGLKSQDSYRKGLFDLQAESSQIACALLPLQTQGTYLDFCAGKGGKTLSLANRLAALNRRPHHKKEHFDWRILASDKYPHRLEALCKRLRKHPHWPVRCLTQEELSAAPLADVLLLDVPCSSSGLWRRHPEYRHQITLPKLQAFVSLQRQIIVNALARLKKGGLCVYMTCSLFTEENEGQALFLEQIQGLKPASIDTSSLNRPLPRSVFCGNKGHMIRLDPLHTGTDGFFLAFFQKPP